MQPFVKAVQTSTYETESQSPYGAMWFATGAREPYGRGGLFAVAIPLRGYVVCNIWSHPQVALTFVGASQSPYGAMWFATLPP
jgi:hypothetical protein